MQKSKYILILLLLVGLVACYYHPDLPADGTSENKTDSVPEALHKRAYALSSNFEVEADTLWLHQLPFMDTISVVKGNFAVYSFVQQFAYLAFLSGAGRILSMVCLSGSAEEAD